MAKRAQNAEHLNIKWSKHCARREEKGQQFVNFQRNSGCQARIFTFGSTAPAKTFVVSKKSAWPSTDLRVNQAAQSSRACRTSASICWASASTLSNFRSGLR